MKIAEDMRVFARVVEKESFSAAAEDFGMTPSAISKLVTRLEARLNVRLLHRTTRRLALTAEGQAYYLRACGILAAIDEAESELSNSIEPQGRLRINSLVPFAVHFCAKPMQEFNTRYPKIAIELTASDRTVDLLAENTDVAIRTGAIREQFLIARKITDIYRHIYASPEYIKRRGAPKFPNELVQHDCITIKTISTGTRWSFEQSKRIETIDIVRQIVVDNSESAYELALAGCGIVRLADIVAAEAERKGRLVRLFARRHVLEPVPMSAVYPQGRQAMPKVRVFIDFLLEKFRKSPWDLRVR